MWRHVASIIWLISLAMCVATIALWVRSYSHTDGIQKNWVDPLAPGSYARHIGSGNGSLFYHYRDEKYLKKRDFSSLAYQSERYNGRWRYATAPGRLNYGMPQNAWQQYGFDARVRRNWRKQTDLSLLRKSLEKRLNDADLQRTLEHYRLKNLEEKRLGQGSIITEFYFRVPHWLVAGLFAIGPAIWVPRRMRQIHRERRLRHGLCPACGYDLRASGGTCPECGQAVTRPPDGAALSGGA